MSKCEKCINIIQVDDGEAVILLSHLVQPECYATLKEFESEYKPKFCPECGTKNEEV